VAGWAAGTLSVLCGAVSMEDAHQGGGGGHQGQGEGGEVAGWAAGTLAQPCSSRTPHPTGKPPAHHAALAV